MRLGRRARRELIIPVRFPPQLDLETYDTFRKYVEHEDDLVNHRISWMLLVHGFLYAGYAVALKIKFDLLEKIDKHTKHPPDYLASARFQTVFFIFLISAVGFCVSLVAFMSINAARKAAENVQKVFEGQYKPTFGYGVRETVQSENGLVLPTIAGGGDKNNKIFGLSSALSIPFVMILGWLFAFLIEIIYLTPDWWAHMFHVVLSFLCQTALASGQLAHSKTWVSRNSFRNLPSGS